MSLQAILIWTALGFVAGILAKWIMPGKQGWNPITSILLGIVGSFIGGFLGYLLMGKDLDEGALQPSGIIGSILGAVIALLVWRRVGHGDGHRMHA